MLYARDDAGGRREVGTRVGQQLGVPPDTLGGWVQQTEINERARPRTTSDERVRLMELERENCELWRTDAILKAASAFFAAKQGRSQNR